MKEYLDKSILLDYLRARVEMGEYVVNDDLLDEKTKDKNKAVVLDRKDLVSIVEGMSPEDPYKKIIHRLEYLINYYQNWGPTGASQYRMGQVFAYKDILSFIRNIDNERDPFEGDQNAMRALSKEKFVKDILAYLKEEMKLEEEVGLILWEMIGMTTTEC